VFAVLVVLFAITIAFTLTPGIGGVALAVGLWIGLSSRRGSKLVRRCALESGSLAAILFLLVSTFSLIRSPTSPYHFEIFSLHIEPTQRLLTWQGAATTFLEDPLFGRGLGLPAANVTYMPPSGQIQLLTDAHNAFLNVGAQAGILGLLSLGLTVMLIVRRALYSPFNSSFLNAMGIAFISAFIYQGLVGSFENARHLWVLMGLILALSRMPVNDESRSGRFT
jgi:O-antigen ligase